MLYRIFLIFESLRTPNTHERSHRSFTFKTYANETDSLINDRWNPGQFHFFDTPSKYCSNVTQIDFCLPKTVFIGSETFAGYKNGRVSPCRFSWGNSSWGMVWGLSVFVLSGKFGLTTVDVFIISTRLRGTISACRLCLII